MIKNFKLRFIVCLLSAILALAPVIVQAQLAGGLLFPGPGIITGSGGGALLTYIGTATNSTSTTTPNFASQGIGTAASDRVVIVCAQSVTGSATQSISGITIGGVSATLIVQTNSTTSGFGIAAGCYGLLVTTGTTSTIIVTYTNSQLRGTIAVYNLNATSGVVTPFHSNSNTNTVSPVSTTLNTTAGGAALGFMISSNGTTTWTGLSTKDVDSATAASTMQYSGAHSNSTSSATGASIQASSTASAPMIIVAASW